MFHFPSFPIPFPDSFTLNSPLYFPASFPFFSSPPHRTEPNQTHPNFLFPFQIFLILQGFSGFLSLFDFSLTTGPLTKPNQIELKMKSGNKSENGYRKRAGRVFVLLALCVIFRILPESNTRTNLI